MLIDTFCGSYHFECVWSGFSTSSFLLLLLLTGPSGNLSPGAKSLAAFAGLGSAHETWSERRKRIRRERIEHMRSKQEARRNPDNLPEDYLVPGWPKHRSRQVRDYLYPGKNSMLIAPRGRQDMLIEGGARNGKSDGGFSGVAGSSPGLTKDPNPGPRYLAVSDL